MSSTSLAISSRVRPSLRTRLARHVRAHLAALAGAVTLLIAGPGLMITHRPLPPAIPKPVALRMVMADPAIAKMLATLHWERSDVTPMDHHYELLGFYRGGRMLATITVGANGGHTFLDAVDLTKQHYAYGSNIANNVWMLALLSAVFILMTAVWPLWRLRNLDVLVAASTVSAVVLFNDWMLTRMALTAYPALFYLALRCAWWGLAGHRQPAPARPLYNHLTRNWTAPQRLRVLRLMAAALALVTAMVGFTSPHVLDVGYAVMEGATAILHGVLPYGHIADVLHGDTYPIASYLLYVPFAALSPVHTAWDNADFTLVVAVVAAIAAAIGVWRVLAERGAGRPRASGPSELTGLRAAVAVLAFPPLLVTVSTGTTDVVLGAMLVATFVLWHRPGWALAALSAATWFKLAPLAVVPLLLARLRGRVLLSAAAAVAVVSATMLGVLIALGGVGAPGRMLSAMSFQFTRSSPHTLWAVVGSVPLQQLAQAAVLALIAGASVRLARDGALADDRFRIAAVVGAILIGIQITANYWNYMYLIWALPFIVLWLFAGGEAAPLPAAMSRSGAGSAAAVSRSGWTP